MKNEEITEAIENLTQMLGNNVSTITYDTNADKWLIMYKSGLNPDAVYTENLIEHIENV